MKRKVYNIFILVLLFLIYLLDNVSYFSYNRRDYFIYIIKPLMWFGAGLIVHRLPKVKYRSKAKYKGFLSEWVLILALIHVVFQFFMGFIFGFGKNPYNLTIIRILENYIVFFLALIGQEKVREYLVNNGSKHHYLLRISIVVSIFTFINISMNKIFGLRNILEILQFLGEEVLPKLCLNIAAVYLVFLGGAGLSFLYIGIIQGIKYICPVLPNLSWIITAVTGIFVPICSMMFLHYTYLRQSKGFKRRDKYTVNPISWILTTLASILMLWFFIGVFPVYPAAIATGSMKPAVQPGDMVLVKRLKDGEVKVGDIVEYKKDDIYIFHRIIQIAEGKNEIMYETKGDNNASADSDLVTIDMIKGKVIRVIPKAGWPALIIRRSKGDIKI